MLEHSVFSAEGLYAAIKDKMNSHAHALLSHNDLKLKLGAK